MTRSVATYLLGFVSLVTIGLYSNQYFGIFASNFRQFLYKNDYSGRFNNDNLLGYFDGSVKESPPTRDAIEGDVLSSTGENKRIEVDLTNQRLYGYEGDKKVFDFLVSTGKWGRTPPGNYRIWVKLRYVLMSGGSKSLGTYYYLPNVPYTMFFEGKTDEGEIISRGRGYALHGTYWHNNFGHPMSHGCVNMKTSEAEIVYKWANPILSVKTQSVYANKDNLGTPVTIFGIPPQE